MSKPHMQAVEKVSPRVAGPGASDRYRSFDIYSNSRKMNAGAYGIANRMMLKRLRSVDRTETKITFASSCGHDTC